ncbi:MAG: UDP-3-O-(3-hydroxymyristoyl)glucosamine N-acyltransferase [Phycisphaerales bacterium]|nr:UDP-3-O-(3-hydroxymyristoyl)glucosamine N-acyltransferase [Phycisphaerales bacterium]
MAMTVAELAKAVGGVVVGDGTKVVESCNTLMEATAEQVSLLHNAKYARELDTTRAGCVIVAPGTVKGGGEAGLTLIEAKNAYYAWQQTMVMLHGQRRHESVGISQQAAIHPTAKLGKNVSVHPFAVIGENVEIGDATTVYSHVTLQRGVKIGKETVLYPSVTVYEECVIGDRCLINAGTVIGSDGFSYAQEGGVHHKMPQRGNVRIEDDVEIGCNAVVERAALGSTVVGRGTKIGNLVVVGHNCRIGQGNLLISQVGIAGSTNTGKYVVMAGQAGVNGHLDIPDFVKVGAQAGVMTNPEPNAEIVGTPAMAATEVKRIFLNTLRLPELAKRVKELEKKLGEKPEARSQKPEENSKLETRNSR